MQKKHLATKRRAEKFADKIPSRICKETPDDDNPYLAKSIRYHGYELQDLAENCSYVSTLFLLFMGELPSKSQTELLEKLMVALINPGPRHPATRAAMYAAVSKTEPSHILPIGLTILSGSHRGAAEVENSMRFLRKNLANKPEDVARELFEKFTADKNEDQSVAPGFGQTYQSTDPVIRNIANYFRTLTGAERALKWGHQFATATEEYGMGWLRTGLAAAVFCDLGFQPRAAAGLFQLICAPGILAHGLEVANKKLHAMPFPEDANYVIERNE